MGFKEISPLEAMNALADGRPVYRFSRMSQELLAKTSVSGFLNLRFAVEGDYPPVDDTEEPEPVAKEVWTSPRFTDATGPTAAVVVPSPADL